jgi:hypothetical protein
VHFFDADRLAGEDLTEISFLATERLGGMCRCFPILSRNWLHVLAKDLEVPALPIAEVSSNGEYVAVAAETKARLVVEADSEVQRSVIDGVADEIHDLAVDLRILPAQPFLPLLAAPFNLPAFFSGDSRHGRFPAPLLPALPGVLFLPLQLRFPALFFGSDRGRPIRLDLEPPRTRPARDEKG